MKKRNFIRKLVLNKETIANLKENEMTNVKGGWFAPAYTQAADCSELPPYDSQACYSGQVGDCNNTITVFPKD